MFRRSAMLCLLIIGSILAPGAGMLHAAEGKTPVPASGNQQMFTPAERELQLPDGTQDIIALATLACYLLLGAWIVYKTGTYVSSAICLLGVGTFYSGLIHHQWVISGHYPIGTGHLISLGICSLGVAILIPGVEVMLRDMRRISKSLSYPTILYPLYILVFTLGCFTGHATIFEAAPTIFGMDMPLHYLAVMTLMGSAAITASILCAAHGLVRMRVI